MPLIDGQWVDRYVYPGEEANVVCSTCGHKAFDHAEFFQETDRGCLRRFCTCQSKFHTVARGDLAAPTGDDT